MEEDEKEPARAYSHWLEARDEADACVETEFLTTLAEVVAGKADAGELDRFGVWPEA